MKKKESKKDFEYIILSPIAPHKRYSLDRFVKNIAKFKPSPKKMVFCCEPEDVFEISKKKPIFEEKKIELIIFTLGPETLEKHGMTQLGRICDSRNILRSFFIKSDFDWALLLDSDIIPTDKRTPSILHGIAVKEKSLAVINRYPGRDDDSPPWNGVAFTLMHRTAAALAEFQVCPIIWEGKESGRLSEDFTYLSILRSGNNFIKNCTGWKSHSIGNYVPVIHEIDPGKDKFLDKE